MAYVTEMGPCHRWLTELIDPIRLRTSEEQLSGYRNEFDDDVGGRGDSYRAAQCDRLARSVGVVTLLRAAGCGGEPRIVLDAFGGDGVVAHVWAAQGGTDRVITADVSATMIERAKASGLPVVRQSAHRMVLIDNSIDVVLMAYGTHHLELEHRSTAFAEAHRVLRPNGRIVVHDFDEQSPMAAWFAQVVDRHSRDGHPYHHFTRTSLSDALNRTGFADIHVQDCYDPFRIYRATPGAAVKALAEHLAYMYGLREAMAQLGVGWLIRRYTELFRLSETNLPSGAVRRSMVISTPDGYLAELPRMSLVATATKAWVEGI